MTEPGPVQVLIEVSPAVAMVRFDRWAPQPFAVLVKDAGAKWHRRNRCWTLPPAAARPLADALTAAGAEVTRRVVQPVDRAYWVPRKFVQHELTEDWAAVRATAAALLAIPSWAEVAAQLLESPELLEPPASPDAPAEPLCLPEPLCPPARPGAPPEPLSASEPLGTPARPVLPAGPLKAPDPLKAPAWDGVDAAPLQARMPLQSGSGDRER